MLKHGLTIFMAGMIAIFGAVLLLVYLPYKLALIVLDAFKGDR